MEESLTDRVRRRLLAHDPKSTEPVGPKLEIILDEIEDFVESVRRDTLRKAFALKIYEEGQSPAS